MPQTPVRVPSQRPLARVSRQSLLSTNDKGDNEMLCRDLLAFTSQLRKISTRRPSMKSVRLVIASNGVPYILMRSVGSHSRSEREKEGKKERTGYSFAILSGLSVECMYL